MKDPESSSRLKDEAQNNIVPLTLNGTPEELDTGFMQVVGRPMQKASGLISNMAQFEAQADKAASSSKGAKEAKAKESKEGREKREKYEKNLKKAEEHIAAKRHKEAVDALTEARKYAKPDDLKTIDERLDEQKKLVGQGDLFAMMGEPEQAQPQQPAQQPATAQPQPFTFKKGTATITLDDPNPSDSPEMVMGFYSNTYPELTTATACT